MAKIGLDNFLYAELTESGGSATYGTAKKPGKAISCNVNITNYNAKLYADDVVAESDSGFQSGTVSIVIDDDDLQMQADLLGHTITSGEIVRNGDDVAPYVGFGRIIKKLVNGTPKYKVEFIHKAQFSEPNQEDKTKGEQIEFGTTTLEGTIMQLANGDWSKAQVFDNHSAAVTYLEGLFT